MKLKIATGLATSALILSASAMAPGPASPSFAGLGAPSSGEAAVSKSLSAAGGGGGNVAGAGNRLSSLLTGWAVPVLIVLGGCLLIGALLSRNIGASVGIVVVTLIGLIFLLAPSSIESLAKQIASTVL
ncbi:MAG TPA: hypothetical protein VND98_07350 [Solirubrobacterales bacterium]|nr:hypothetical protein [Solirubrobacterales bacterium]